MNKGPKRRKLLVLGIVAAILVGIILTANTGCSTAKSLTTKSASPSGGAITVPLTGDTAAIPANAAALNGSPTNPGTAPLVTTNGAVNVTDTSATLQGTFGSLGTAPAVNISFQWGTSPGSYANETPPTTMGTTAPYQAEISGLTSGTKYYFRAKAAGAGTAFGSEMSFTAGQAAASSNALAVATRDAVNVTSNSATLRGSLDGWGNIASMNVSFLWGTVQASLTNETAATTMGTTGAFQSDLTGLSSGTTYYFKARGTNGTTTIYGNQVSFKTP